MYDLGGGTFDASLVDLDDKTHTVVASAGIGTLGGDDFDHLLAEMAAGEAVLAGLSGAELFRLLDECRRQKEALHPNTRKIAVDWTTCARAGGRSRSPRPRTTSAAGRWSRRPFAPCRPRRGSADAGAVRHGRRERAAAVARMLREEFGRRVRRSTYTRSATAIGLAIQADASSGYALRDVFSRNFGVWREGEQGAA